MPKKCAWFNDHRAATTLMLDDLSLTATTLDGSLEPGVDWGYGLAGEGSLYRYLEETLLSRYPEIKGTFFFPLRPHAAQNPNAGYTLLFRDADAEFARFLDRASRHFEIAFHGTDHGRFEAPGNPAFGNWIQEFDMLGPGDADRLRTEIRAMESLLGRRFFGGKYPGYRSGGHGAEIVDALGFEWWAASVDMLGRAHPGNAHGYLPGTNRVLDFPTNFSGAAFNPGLPRKGAAILLSRLRETVRLGRSEEQLRHLYEGGFVISVQEHLQNARTDGMRQTPNAYDDLASLERIYAILRTLDVWHADCTSIARYLECRDRTTLATLDKGRFELRYEGNRNDPRLSLRAESPAYVSDAGVRIVGRYKDGAWILNNVPPGRYSQAGG
ncbi:MAG: hypothetical protein JF616_02715 [Fibrobacteres bacterium]|jgi:hypothetical protein|nr:hypothetical protein [Fibrobacterota bacterium]